MSELCQIMYIACLMICPQQGDECLWDKEAIIVQNAEHFVDSFTWIEDGQSNTSTPTPVPEEKEWTVDWYALADCESGNWVDGGSLFETGSARWQWAKPGVGVPPWGTTIHHGGLQFHPDTWEWLKPGDFPQYAYDATPEQQMEVAELVLDAQGLRAWPVCTRKLGWR